MQQGGSTVGKSGRGAPRETLVILLARSGNVQRAGLDFSSSQGAAKVRKARIRSSLAVLRGQVEANPQWGVFRTSTKLY
jgi:hypothetical protein